MKIRIKTELVDFEIQDEVTIDKNQFIKRQVDSTVDCIKVCIDEVIKLHNNIKKD